MTHPADTHPVGPVLGVDAAGRPLTTSPHAVIYGSAGSGKALGLSARPRNGDIVLTLDLRDRS